MKNAKRIIGIIFTTAMILGVSIPAFAGQWKKDSNGWWYQNNDKSYPKSNWRQVDNRWYHFNRDGYMQTGWYQESGKWYFLNEDGAMAASSWIQNNGKWYYLSHDGSMLKNSVTPDGYFVNETGEWVNNNEQVTKSKVIDAYYDFLENSDIVTFRKKSPYNEYYGTLNGISSRRSDVDTLLEVTPEYYYIRDITNDSIPELIIVSTQSGWSDTDYLHEFIVCTFTNGEVVPVCGGDIGKHWNCLGLMNNNYLTSYGSGTSGYHSIDFHSIKNGKAEYAFYQSFNVPTGDGWEKPVYIKGDTLSTEAEFDLDPSGKAITSKYYFVIKGGYYDGQFSAEQTLYLNKNNALSKKRN